MTENRSNPERVDDGGRPKEHKARRLIWLGGAGVALLVVMTMYVNLGHSRPLRISKETTYITEPLKSDGKQVDYFAAIRQATRPGNAATDENGYRLIVRHLGKGPEAEPWYFARICEELGLDASTLRPDMPYQQADVFLGAYVNSDRFDESLFEQLPPDDEAPHDEFSPPPAPPSREGVQWMLHEKVYRPWTLDELPMMAEWLEQNGPALDLIGRAVRKPTFYIPIVRQSEDELLWALLLPEIHRMRSFARGLSARANYRIGTGDIDGAIDDIVTCKRLGRHVGHGATLIDLLVGTAVEGIADAGIAGSLDHPPTKEQLKRLLAEIDELPAAAKIEKRAAFERFYALDIIQSRSHGTESLDDWHSLDWDPPAILAKLSIDWNVVARRFNELFDEIQATGEPPLNVEIRPGTATRLVSLRARSELWGEVMAALLGPSWSAVLEAGRRHDCIQQVRRITLAVLLYERDHGTLPPAHSADAAGNPLHSWRVLLLPYLGHESLYEKIRLDEPWDSPHNRQFHGEAVAFYRCPSDPAAKPGQTTYSVVVGPDMPFEAGEGKRLADFGPDSDDMILVGERTDPVCWMDPTREVSQAAADEGIDARSFGSGPPGPGRIGSHHPGVANFGFRNGAVRPLSSAEDDFDEVDRQELFKRLLRGTNTEKSLDY